jgi:hypothetical protein
MTGEMGNRNGVQRIMIWSALVLILTIVTMLFVNLSRVSAHDAGRIELSNFQHKLDGANLDMRVNAKVSLSPTVQAGLNSGVPLTFIINVDIQQPQRWWLDKTVLTFQRRFTLTYYDLTRHYRVSAVEADDSRNFRSLSSALTGMGEMVRIRAELDREQVSLIKLQGLLASVNMQLSRSALPLPLQPIIRSSWTLVSEDFRWPIT